MRVVLFLILLGVNYVLSGQGLTNAVISVDDINFSSRQLVRVSDQRFLLTSFNRINNQIASTIINYSTETNTYYQFDSFEFFLSRRSTVFDGDNILVIGANTANQFLLFNSWSLDFNEVYSNNILPLNDLSGVRLSMFYNNHLYAVGYDDDFGLASRSIDFRKFSKTGDELVAHKLDQAVVFNMVQDIDSTLDNNLVISSRIAYSSDGGRFSQLTKIDTLGVVIWQVEGSEAFGQNYWANYIAQLSNGNIVETYKIENNTNPEFNESAIRM